MKAILCIFFKDLKALLQWVYSALGKDDPPTFTDW
jgi:hypothetical protein